jgi:hypothetical protein
MDVVTLVESILEDPAIVLLKQLDALKTERLAELKAQGVEYAERMEELEKLEHPKPLRDFVYGTFDAFALKHPWVGHENIRPKSMRPRHAGALRDLQTTTCAEYELQRSEGVLLRYLSTRTRRSAQTVPESYRDEALEEALQSLRRTVREADSSLIDEWERLQRRLPARAGRLTGGGPVGPTSAGGSRRGSGPSSTGSSRPWRRRRGTTPSPASRRARSGPPESLAAETGPYFAAHERIVLTPEARRPSMAWSAPTRRALGGPAEDPLSRTARRTGCWTVP